MIYGTFSQVALAALKVLWFFYRIALAKVAISKLLRMKRGSS